MGNNLKLLRKQKKWTLEKAAEAMGMSKGGYVKIERGENQLTTASIAKAAKAFGVNEVDIISDKNPTDDVAFGPVPVNLAKVNGVAQAGVWTEFEDFEDDAFKGVEIPMISGKWANLSQFAYFVRGNSMDKDRIFDGDYVICVPYFDAREDITDGDRVVVERRRFSSVERTVKQIEIHGKEVRFCPRSTDARIKPISVTPNGDMREADDTEVRLVGLVIGRWSPY